MRITGLAAIGVLALAGCAANDVSGPPRMSDDIMMGGQYEQPWLGKLLKEAAAYPLGSEKNPVRASMPAGQHSYLDRLRCADGKTPVYDRTGNLGAGVYGSIVDAYDVRCTGSSPAQTQVIMDMYFHGYQETLPVPGFRIVPP